MNVTHPRLLDTEGTGSTFPQNVCSYLSPQHIIPQDYNPHLHSYQKRQLIHSLNCFNLHYGMCTNYNLMAREFHYLFSGKFTVSHYVKFDKHNLKLILHYYRPF
jgi:hypothetical protein